MFVAHVPSYDQAPEKVHGEEAAAVVHHCIETEGVDVSGCVDLSENLNPLFQFLKRNLFSHLLSL